jgi:hypothetical protein
LRFEKLNEMIPYSKGGKAKILEMHPYNAITLRMPGRHALDTTPVGGDFVVCVDDDVLDWTEHQFTHSDLFGDIELKYNDVPNAAFYLMQNYLQIVNGDDPDKIELEFTDGIFFDLGLHPQTFLYAVQCLAVAEHRRYPQHEAKFGGRFLPFRAAAGIAEGLWTALEASEKTRTRGRLGVEWLEKEKGTPTLTKELFNG